MRPRTAYQPATIMTATMANRARVQRPAGLATFETTTMVKKARAA